MIVIQSLSKSTSRLIAQIIKTNTIIIFSFCTLNAQKLTIYINISVQTDS